MKRGKTVVKILTVGLLACFLAACKGPDGGGNGSAVEQTERRQQGDGNGNGQEGIQAEGGTLTMASYGDVEGIAAWDLKDVLDGTELCCVYEPLFKQDEEGNCYGFLAESLETDYNAGVYTVKLREDVYFSDGSHLDADVLLWNFQHYKEVSINSATHFGNVDYFEKTGDYTVAIHMKEWDSQIPYALMYTAGFMYSKQAYDEHGEEWCLSNAVGTGPYVAADCVANDYRTYVKNENYWNPEGQAYFDTIKWVVIDDEMTAQAALQTGEIDGYLGASYAMLNTMESMGFQNISSVTRQVQCLVFASAVESSPLSDVKVRQAICHGIDPQAIIDTVTFGMAEFTNQQAIPGTPFYNEEVVGYTYDVERAKELLAEAGYPNGFTTKIVVENVAPYTEIATFLQSQLAQIGITLEVKLDERSLWFEELYGIDEGFIISRNSFDFDLCMNLQSNYSHKAREGVGMLKNSKIHPDDLNELIEGTIQAKTMEEMLEKEKQVQKLLIDKYCIMYPVFWNARGYITLSPDLEDTNCFSTKSSSLDYNMIRRVK